MRYGAKIAYQKKLVQVTHNVATAASAAEALWISSLLDEPRFRRVCVWDTSSIILQF